MPKCPKCHGTGRIKAEPLTYAERVLRVRYPSCGARARQLCRGSQKPRVKTPHVDRVDEAKRQGWVSR
jgi:hypothetical protein